jgi:hypothetical protein
LRPLLKDVPVLNQLDSNSDVMNDEEYLAAEYRHIFENSKSNEYYDIFIKNNMANK